MLIMGWGWIYHGSLLTILMLPIGGALGPFVGLFSDAPYFTANFKLVLFTGLLISGLVAWIGLRSCQKWWGQLLVVIGVLAWCLCGLVGFGPQ